MQGVTIAPTPSAVLLGRSVTICFGVGSAGLVYLIGRQLREGPWVGLLAALMVAISPTMVGLSRFVTSDSQVTFFALSSLLAALLAMKQGKTRHYVAAGLFAGLAASSKYNGALILVSLALAHAFRFGKQALWKRGLYVAAAAAAIGFIATTPYSILDPSSFMSGLRYEAAHYALGHAGMEGDAPAGQALWRRRARTISASWFRDSEWLVVTPQEVAIVVIFIAVYFAFISSFAVRRSDLPACSAFPICTCFRLRGRPYIASRRRDSSSAFCARRAYRCVRGRFGDCPQRIPFKYGRCHPPIDGSGQPADGKDLDRQLSAAKVPNRD
jgi:4-amino-4-deoxy-L-arabinose transferase-like glycosyltransferase